jgi:glycosyltransferase involved in cell wall biosynthesis
MKILYIAPDITDSGGISRVVSLKTNYLVANLGYEISILSVNNNYPNCFYDFNPLIKWCSIERTKNIFFFFRNYIRLIKKTISKEKPDVIVICDAVYWLFIPWFIKTEIPVIFETHFSVFFKKEDFNSLYKKLRSKLILFWKKKTISKFSHCVFISSYSSNEWGVNNGKVIPNPLSFSINEKAFLVNKKAMAVCMNPYVKGLDRLLLIWSKVIIINPDWELDVYGQWEPNCEYQKLTDTLKIANSVNFLLPTADIHNSFNQSSVFLMTSRSEVFPMVLLEAMTLGVPCIAYDCPSGPRAIIEEGINGFLIEDGNLESFVQKLELLIENQKLRLKIGSTAQESVRKYEIGFIMKKWDELFMNLK